MQPETATRCVYCTEPRLRGREHEPLQTLFFISSLASLRRPLSGRINDFILFSDTNECHHWGGQGIGASPNKRRGSTLEPEAPLQRPAQSQTEVPGSAQRMPIRRSQGPGRVACRCQVGPQRAHCAEPRRSPVAPSPPFWRRALQLGLEPCPRQENRSSRAKRKQNVLQGQNISRNVTQPSFHMLAARPSPPSMPG
ncbi:hypothetical protein NDU88_005978 [Pleurodeles waltl]|uniref:Uncharacterized protein n=1 Tax=Pleurodeles waltl TaxID=8319 RepID=A0AAV7WZ93_PLEWA|nr:hypothetical protein NDU88_005978 [Pleurodeles waltl]